MTEVLIAIVTLAGFIYLVFIGQRSLVEYFYDRSDKDLKSRVGNAKAIIKKFENSVKKNFVYPELSIKPINNEKMKITSNELMNSFSSESSSSVFYLLGEFGTGKTWFMRYIEYELAKQFIKSPKKNFFPAYFNLADIKDLSEPLENILSFIINKKLGFHDFPQFENYVFLLDSLDEASRQNGFTQFSLFLERVNNYSTSLKKAKIIVASRKSFFKEIKSNTQLLKVDPMIDSIEVYLEFWKKEKIKEYVSFRKKLSSDMRSKIFDFVEKHYEIAGRALIAGMLVEKWEQFKSIIEGDDFDEYTLFDKMIYVTLDEWASRAAVIDNPLFLEKLYFFVKLLALSFLDSESSQKIEVLELEKRLYQKFNNVKFYNLTRIQIKSRSLLELTEDGKHYQFCHRAIWEFIVAQLIINAVEELGKNINHERKEFNLTVIKQARRAPELYISIAEQFIIPFLEKRNRLDVLEKQLPAIKLS